MKHEKMRNSPAIGLDLGTSRIVTASGKEAPFEFQSQLNAFVSIPFSKMTEGALRKESIPFATRNSHIFVHGNTSEKFADLLGVEPRRPMTGGILNPSEAESLLVIQKIVELLIGSGKESQPLCFSVPAPLIGAEENLTYHESSVRQMLSELGYGVKSINEGLAVIYGEMESSNYTGIGISCGGGLCNVCLAYLSVPVLSFSIRKAGDFIDASAASATGDLATRVRIAKESSFHFNGASPDKTQQALSVYYDDMMRTLVAGMQEAFASARTLRKFDRPIPLVLSGGTALPSGFAPRFESILKSSEFPIPLAEVRLAEDPLHTTAKGALVAALSEM
jgi:hypothetical protein